MSDLMPRFHNSSFILRITELESTPFSIFRFLKKIPNGNFQDIDYVKVSPGLEKVVLGKFGSLKLTILMEIMVSEMTLSW